ncbi:TPA_asm: M [Asclepias syriaca virus 2]|uniref:M n=1 Tax=Asclepias syriaca virus 2 TaxID=2793723 RepID=A0A8D9PH88_9RHAB|nr:M [Asclepias syriaca virus 2] [Asclepias syriaca virus 2]DAF42294.1 TPA_asm: M [Asclepias syriaca virus 2]
MVLSFPSIIFAQGTIGFKSLDKEKKPSEKLLSGYQACWETKERRRRMKIHHEETRNGNNGPIKEGNITREDDEFEILRKIISGVLLTIKPTILDSSDDDDHYGKCYLYEMVMGGSGDQDHDKVLMMLPKNLSGSFRVASPPAKGSLDKDHGVIVSNIEIFISPLTAEQFKASKLAKVPLYPMYRFHPELYLNSDDEEHSDDDQTDKSEDEGPSSPGKRKGRGRKAFTHNNKEEESTGDKRIRFGTPNLDI